MLHYILRRLFIAVFTLMLITFIIYALIRNIPGTPLTTDPAMMDPSKMVSEDDLKRLERAYGLDLPWYEAYFVWLGNAMAGDLGSSFQEKKPVVDVIGRRIGPTMLLSISSFFLIYLLSVPMGLYATVRRGKPDERLLSTLLYMLYSLPSFVAGLLLLIVFYQNLQGTAFELAPGLHGPGYEEMSFFGKVIDTFKHMILPVTCYTYASLAYMTRFVKANMEEVIRQDYIRTAQAKGVGPTKVICWHAFRNTMIPFVTMIGLTIPGLLGGSVILEQIFNWPGMGQLFLASITFRDYPVIMGLTLMFSILTLLAQLLADVLYAVVDPRITYS